MFNDRDLGVIGMAAAAAVLCLLLPVSFAWKAAIGLFVLVAGMIAAFLRLGRDGLTVEDWLVRRIRFALRPKSWVYREKVFPPAFRKLKPNPAASDQAPAAEGLLPSSDSDPKPLVLRMDFGTVQSERLASLLMIVIGFYFTAWLWSGGAAAIGLDLEVFLP